jgi:hypothetical protein
VAAVAYYIGIDYSGANTPTTSLKGLRVHVAEGDAPPVEVLPPPLPAQILDAARRFDRAAGKGLDTGRSRLDPRGQKAR